MNAVNGLSSKRVSRTAAANGRRSDRAAAVSCAHPGRIGNESTWNTATWLTPSSNAAAINRSR